ncbi:MAG: MqnA/MqnD/SBP family protein [bacterium]
MRTTSNSKRTISREEVGGGKLRIAIPGKYTTANLLLRLAFPEARDKTELVFSSIEPALLEEKYDAGLIIHENQFTYEAKGLKKIIDLGEFWESETGVPLPLGGMAINRSLPDDIKHRVIRMLRRSVEYALANRQASRDFVRANAQEMSEQGRYQHIDLYVNQYSVDLGKEGKRALEIVLERAKESGLNQTRKQLTEIGGRRLLSTPRPVN